MPPRRRNPWDKAVLAPRIAPPERGPTQIQLKILDAVKSLTEEKGYPPSVRDIMRAVGLQSSSSAQHQIDVLQAKGFLTRDKRVARSIRLVPPPGGDAA